MYKILLLLLLASLPFLATAQLQADTVHKEAGKQAAALPKDSLPDVSETKDTSAPLTPKKIGMYSALVPGLGQIYNKQYWKLPIIYAGLGVAAYFVYDNQRNYNRFRSEYAARLNGKGTTGGDLSVYTLEALQYNIDYYQRNRDLTYILTGVGYALQIVDAVVFAHLKGFDISEDITLRMHPVVTPQGGYGFGLALNF